MRGEGRNDWIRWIRVELGRNEKQIFYLAISLINLVHFGRGFDAEAKVERNGMNRIDVSDSVKLRDQYDDWFGAF